MHLTKGTPEQAAESFCAILKDNRLRDFGGMAEDGCDRICFSEAPLSKLGQLIASQHGGFRYQYFGITLEKQWLFEKGGRPVIYQPARERDLLRPSARFRHVTYDPTDSAQRDVTFEREWRIPVAELPLGSDGNDARRSDAGLGVSSAGRAAVAGADEHAGNARLRCTTDDRG